jgi:hypothetical protein
LILATYRQDRRPVILKLLEQLEGPPVVHQSSVRIENETVRDRLRHSIEIHPKPFEKF